MEEPMTDQRMIDTQARHITRLNKELETAARKVIALERQVENLTPAHDYYMAIQKVVLDDDACMEAWQAFLVMVALSQENPIPGLTKPSEFEPQFSLSFGA